MTRKEKIRRSKQLLRTLRGMHETICQEADRLVSGERARHYAHPRDNFRRVANGWNILLDDLLKPGAAIDARMVARMMIWLKLARDVNLPTRDNLVDVAGYARCVERLDEPIA